MHTPGGKSETYSIKNSASLDEIRADETFQFLSEFIEEKGIKRVTEEFHDEKRILIGSDPNFKDKYKFLSDSITSGKIEGIPFNEIRNLKEALNNQICLYVFQEFLSQVSDFEPTEIPCIRKGKHESIEVYPITPKEFVRLDEAAKNVGVIAKLHGVPPELLQLWTSFNGRLITIIQSPEAKARIIGHFLDLFSKVMAVFFEQKVNAIFKQQTGENIQDIVELYLFLEHFVLHHTGEKHRTNYFTSFTQYIVMNNNVHYLVRFLEEFTVENNKLPNKNDIRYFLSRQNNYQLKKSDDMRHAHMHNTEQTKLDTKDWVFKAIDNGNWDSPSKDFVSFGRCPFAKSQIEGTKDNAFLKMFETFDNYLLVIIEELNKRGFK